MSYLQGPPWDLRKRIEIWPNISGDLISNAGRLSLGDGITHSRREFASDVHSRLNCGDAQMIGSYYRIVATSLDEIEAYVSTNDSAVMKSPLSGSGKGISFVRRELSESDKGWWRRTLDKQGSVIVERRFEIMKECADTLVGHYEGFLGVDQMICRSDSPVFILVSEINLRMTMGLIARNQYDIGILPEHL